MLRTEAGRDPNDLTLIELIVGAPGCMPAAGELPLKAILDALPPDIVIGLEVPRLSLAEAGISHLDRVKPCVDAARGLLAPTR